MSDDPRLWTGEVVGRPPPVLWQDEAKVYLRQLPERGYRFRTIQPADLGFDLETGPDFYDLEESRRPWPLATEMWAMEAVSRALDEGGFRAWWDLHGPEDLGNGWTGHIPESEVNDFAMFRESMRSVHHAIHVSANWEMVDPGHTHLGLVGADPAEWWPDLGWHEMTLVGRAWMPVWL